MLRIVRKCQEIVRKCLRNLCRGSRISYAGSAHVRAARLSAGGPCSGQLGQHLPRSPLRWARRTKTAHLETRPSWTTRPGTRPRRGQDGLAQKFVNKLLMNRPRRGQDGPVLKQDRLLTARQSKTKTAVFIRRAHLSLPGGWATCPSAIRNVTCTILNHVRQ